MGKINLVVIIDDDPIYVFGLQKLIEIDNFASEVKTFINGKEALEYIENSFKESLNLPDVILLDINMPVMNGWEFLDLINPLSKLYSKKLNIYVVSSSVSDEDRTRALSFSIVKDYLIKPITLESFEKIRSKIE